MDEKIKITLDNETGEITVEAKGMKGKVCLSKIKFLVDDLMGANPTLEHKPEFYQQEAIQSTVKLG